MESDLNSCSLASVWEEAAYSVITWRAEHNDPNLWS